MSKVSTLTKAISASKSIFSSNILLSTPQYVFSRATKKPASLHTNPFAKQQVPNFQRPRYFSKQQKLDNLTKSALNQYQQKLKQIRDQHSKLQQEIYTKHDQMAKQLKKTHTINTIKSNQQQQLHLSPQQLQQQLLESQQQLEMMLADIETRKFNQIMDNKAAMVSKISAVTDTSKKDIFKARKQYQLDYIKKYMLENMKQLKQEPSQMETLFGGNLASKDQPAYIPNNLVIKKLYFKTSQGKQRKILLAGVEQNDQDHCAYVKTLIQKMKINHILTMTPPDLPYFIKTETSFLTEWMQFLKAPTPSTKFYLNPNPKTLADITLNRNFIPHVLSSMTKSKSFYQTTFSLMQMNEVNFSYQHQPLYSGLVSSTAENVYFCDYPFLKEREMIALNMKLEDLRQLAKRHAYYKQMKRENFSAELLLPKNVVEKKFRHIIKMAKTIALTTESSPMLICDASLAQVLAQEWKKSPLQFMQFDYQQNSYLLDMELYKVPENQVLFIEFIEKLVILDIVLLPLIQKYFVKYNSFPFSCRNTVGGKENLTKVFLLWRHYFNIYDKAIKGKNFDKRDYEHMGVQV